MGTRNLKNTDDHDIGSIINLTAFDYLVFHSHPILCKEKPHQTSKLSCQNLMLTRKGPEEYHHVENTRLQFQSVNPLKSLYQNTNSPSCSYTLERCYNILISSIIIIDGIIAGVTIDLNLQVLFSVAT